MIDLSGHVVNRCRRLIMGQSACLLLGLFGCFLAPVPVIAAQWQFEAGMIWRGSMTAEAGGTSYTQLFNLEVARPYRLIPALSTGRAVQVEENDDDISLIGERTFDDGFVGTDWLTIFDLGTVNFGFDHDSQYDREANTLTFTRTERRPHTVVVGQGTERVRTVDTLIDSSLDSDDHFSGWGVRFDGFRDLASWHGVKIDGLVGFRGYQGLSSTIRGTTFRQTVTDKATAYRDVATYDTVTDTYVFETDPDDTLPAAPYYNRDGDVFADPLIMNTPRSATRDAVSNGNIRRQYGETTTSTWRGGNQIDIGVDANLLQVAVGARLEMSLTPTIVASLRPAILINVADIEVDRSESFFTTSASGTDTVYRTWRDQESETDVLLGIGLEAGMAVAITERLSVSALVGYELIDSTSLHVGPSLVEVDLSSYTCSGLLSYRLQD